MDSAHVGAVSVAVHASVNSDELERLREGSMVYHATPVEPRVKSSTGRVLLTAGARSLCDQPMTVVLPRLFDLADPHACSRCREVLANERGGMGWAS